MNPDKLIMKKYGGTKYNSQWDASTWLILGLVAVCCVVPCFLDDGIWPTIICIVMFAFILLVFCSIYYKIDGDRLVVYTFLHPISYPIGKIKEIRPTKSTLSSPATSLTHRLAITFTDRNILKSTTPLIISPVRCEEFIHQLISINPAISIFPSE